MPRKPKIINPETQQKIDSFVQKSNIQEMEESDEEDYNIYVKSARESNESKRKQDQDTDAVETIEPVKVKKKYVRKASKKDETVLPTTNVVDHNERMYKIFEDYKTEIAELKNIVRGNNQSIPDGTSRVEVKSREGQQPVVKQQPVSQLSDIDIRRQMLKLRFD